MKVLGRLDSERPIEQELPRGGAKQIRTANHFRDSHRGIIHDDGELVRGNSIVPPNQEIAKILPGFKSLQAKSAVMEGDYFTVVHLETPIQSVKLGRRWDATCLAASIWAASARINWFVIFRVGSLGREPQIFPSARARIDSVAPTQSFERAKIMFRPLTL